MATPGQELSSIDFKSMIGGPLTAVIEAQAEAAISSVNFIKEVGFKEDSNDPIYVSFKYPKEITAYVPAVLDDNGTVKTAAIPAKYEMMEFQVPILTMLPIPFIRIEETTIDFNAKINSVETSNSSSSLNVGGSLAFKQKWLGGSVKLNVSASYKKTNSSGSNVDRTYSMAIHVRAVQDEMPAGMEKLLGILENAMLSMPTSQSYEPAKETN